MDSSICSSAVILAASIILLVSVAYAENNQEEFRIITNCMKEFHLKGGELEEINQMKTVPATDNMKCFLGCYMKKMRFINDDGTVNWDNTSKSTEGDFESEEDKTKMREVTSVCRKTANKAAENDCETAFIAIKCFVEEAAKRQLKVFK